MTWYHVHTTTSRSTGGLAGDFRPPSPKPREQRLMVWPHGYRVTAQSLGDCEQPDQLRGVVRGEITGLSEKAAGRMRQFCVEHEVAGAVPFAATLTVRREVSQARFKSVMQAFQQRLRRKFPEWAAVWRAELQRRGVPHLHVILWAPYWMDSAQVRERIGPEWLAAAGESEDREARKRAVLVRDLEGGSENGWIVYAALHNGKKKSEQSGWKGKQWGVWSAENFRARPPIVSVPLSRSQHVEFCRRLRRWSRSRFGGSRLARPWRLVAQEWRGHQRCLTARTVRQLLRGIVDVPPERQAVELTPDQWAELAAEFAGSPAGGGSPGGGAGPGVASPSDSDLAPRGAEAPMCRPAVADA